MATVDGNSMQGLKIKECHRKQPNKTKLAMYKQLLSL